MDATLPDCTLRTTHRTDKGKHRRVALPTLTTVLLFRVACITGNHYRGQEREVAMRARVPRKNSDLQTRATPYIQLLPTPTQLLSQFQLCSLLLIIFFVHRQCVTFCAGSMTEV
jgi:hypothetical protein